MTITYSQRLGFGLLIGCFVQLVCAASSLSGATEAPPRESWGEKRELGPQIFYDLHHQYLEYARHSQTDQEDGSLGDAGQDRRARTSSALEEWQEALDAIGGARMSYRSGLYWFDDWEQALAQSESSGKPILSLRMLGKLTEEHSCANSRFFRTLLYPDPAINEILRERFVLHWQSVRPVPKVSIDFGDGRSITTTLTGNSIHYVVLPDGTVVDALPGLNGPEVFRGWLVQSLEFNSAVNGGFPVVVPGVGRGQQLKQWHAGLINRTVRSWERALAASEDGGTEEGAESSDADATEASRRAITKRRIVELPILANLYGDLERLSNETGDEDWKRLSMTFRESCRLSSEARSIIRDQTNPSLAEGTENGRSELIARRIEKLEATMAWDTAYNQYAVQPQVRRMLVEQGAKLGLYELNEQIYETVFLTPRSDRWLGLLPVDRYTALENDGIQWQGW